MSYPMQEVPGAQFLPMTPIPGPGGYFPATRQSTAIRSGSVDALANDNGNIFAAIEASISNATNYNNYGSGLIENGSMNSQLASDTFPNTQADQDDPALRFNAYFFRGVPWDKSAPVQDSFARGVPLFILRNEGEKENDIRSVLLRLRRNGQSVTYIDNSQCRESLNLAMANKYLQNYQFRLLDAHAQSFPNDTFDDTREILGSARHVYKNSKLSFLGLLDSVYPQADGTFKADFVQRGLAEPPNIWGPKILEGDGVFYTVAPYKMQWFSDFDVFNTLVNPFDMNGRQDAQSNTYENYTNMVPARTHAPATEAAVPLSWPTPALHTPVMPKYDPSVPASLKRAFGPEFWLYQIVPILSTHSSKRPTISDYIDQFGDDWVAQVHGNWKPLRIGCAQHGKNDASFPRLILAGKLNALYGSNEIEYTKEERLMVARDHARAQAGDNLGFQIILSVEELD